MRVSPARLIVGGTEPQGTTPAVSPDGATLTPRSPNGMRARQAGTGTFRTPALNLQNGNDDWCVFYADQSVHLLGTSIH